MEHSAEKLIRQKVHEADQLAVTWRKEWVWHHIDLTPEKKPARWFYYAAASILLAGVSVVFIAQWNERQTTDLKISALETKIASVLEEQRKIAAPVVIAELNCDTSPAVIPVERTQVAIRNVERQPVRELTPAVSTEPQPLENVIAVVEPTIQPQETPVASIQIVKPTVQAIIGIIPAQPETIARTTNKKFRMMLLSAAQLEAEYMSLDENKFITAKLK